MRVDDIVAILYRESGLKGVSVGSGDKRDLLAIDDPGPSDVIDLFAYRISTERGGLSAALPRRAVFLRPQWGHAAAIREAV